MSGFENFQSSDDWLKRFKNFLIEKRTISVPMDSPTLSSPTFDLDKDFQEILEEKCPAIPFKLSYANKENCKPIYNKSSKESFVNQKYNMNDSIFPMTPTSSNCLETTANDSFFFLEKICNKTISDPNSTIHSYVESMRKESTLNSINTSNNTTRDKDNSVIERHLNDQGIKKNNLPERTIFNDGDQTQLNDVEEPSGLWETTISDETLLKMSPTKRVGLLRPSTIIEEANSSYSEPDNSLTNSSVFSFKTALKSTETTSYETANDTNRSERCNKKGNFIIEAKYNNSYLNENKTDIDSTFSDFTSAEKNKIDSLDSDQFNSKNTLDDVSSIVEDSLNKYCSNNVIDNDSLEKDKTLNEGVSIENEESFIEVSDEEDSLSNEVEVNSLNDGFSLQSINDKDNSVMDETLSDSNANCLNISRDFNDTFEEVDYILKQGMKMMNDNSVATQPITVRNTKTATLNFYTPSPIKTPKTPNTIISKQFSIHKTTPTMNDKSDVFKKPTYHVGSRIPQPKSLLNVKKTNPYANVISPVGAYIKNTPKTPIVTNIREATFRTIDHGQIPRTVLSSKMKEITKSNSKEFIRSLPKKAYTSAQYREVRDERTPLNIPGGNKIHKYLQSALMPAVARHDGKMKIMNSSDDNSHNAAINRTVDSSLADLSVMSGDVSVYTIRDAQNFGKNINQN